MKTQPTHTPTPWKTGGMNDRLILDSAGIMLADLANTERKFDEARANTAYIVLAVNAHQELTTWLREAVADLKQLQPNNSHLPQMLTLLAKAKGH